MVQGHRVYHLASRVGMLHKGRFKGYKLKNKSLWRIIPTAGSWVWKKILSLREQVSVHITWTYDGEASWDCEEMPKYKGGLKRTYFCRV
ncbi:hypothetical protein LINPERHAP1_LOCUS30137 [Linum perenne]